MSLTATLICRHPKDAESRPVCANRLFQRYAWKGDQVCKLVENIAHTKKSKVAVIGSILNYDAVFPTVKRCLSKPRHLSK